MFDLTCRPPIVDRLTGMPFSAEWNDGDLCGLQGHPRRLFKIRDINPMKAQASPLCLLHPFDTGEGESIRQALPIMSAADIVSMLSRDAARILAICMRR